MAPIRPILAALLIAALPACHFDIEGKYHAEKEISEEFPLDGASTIEIDFAVGELRLTNSPDDKVRVTGKVVAKGNDQEQLDRLMGEFVLRPSTGQQFELTMPRAEAGVTYTVDLDVAVPAGKDLEASLNVGELKAELELPRTLEITLNVGDLDIILPAGSEAAVDAEVNVGDVSVSGFDTVTGAVERRSFVGAVFEGRLGAAEAPSPKELTARVNVGDIDIRGQ